MINRIASELARDDLSQTVDGVAAIRNAIMDAVYFYQPQAHFINEEIATTPTVAGTASYAFPEDLVSLEVLSIVRYNTVFQLRLRRYRELDAEDSLYPSALQGAPEEYAIWEQSVRLFPTPDDVYTLMFKYYKAIPFPATLGTSNFWTTVGEPLIRARAKFGLNMEVLRDQANAALDKAAEMEAFQAITHQTTEKLHTGSIKPWNG